MLAAHLLAIATALELTVEGLDPDAVVRCILAAIAAHRHYEGQLQSYVAELVADEAASEARATALCQAVHPTAALCTLTRDTVVAHLLSKGWLADTDDPDLWRHDGHRVPLLRGVPVLRVACVWVLAQVEGRGELEVIADLLLRQRHARERAPEEVPAVARASPQRPALPAAQEGASS